MEHLKLAINILLDHYRDPVHDVNWHYADEIPSFIASAIKIIEVYIMLLEDAKKKHKIPISKKRYDEFVRKFNDDLISNKEFKTNSSMALKQIANDLLTDLLNLKEE